MNKVIDPADKLILALDGMDQSEAIELVARLSDLKWVKVGLELFVSAGPEVVEIFREMGKSVFLDLKFHDIPATMFGACREASKRGAELISVHSCAGVSALESASAAVAQGAEEVGLACPTLLAVTVLTSWEPRVFSDELAINQALHERVKWLANLSSKAGIGGCVCSPLELNFLRKSFPENFQLVTPGIRKDKSSLHDQARTMSPIEAVGAGASRIVIGRPITKAKDPIKTFQSFYKDLEVS